VTPVVVIHEPHAVGERVVPPQEAVIESQATVHEQHRRSDAGGLVVEPRFH